jgi:signal peptidase II
MSLKNKFNISLFSIIIIFLVDRISKFYIITLSKKNFDQEIFQSEYLNLVLIWNDGIAFGLLSLQESYLYNLITLLIGFIILV